MAPRIVVVDAEDHFDQVWAVALLEHAGEEPLDEPGAPPRGEQERYALVHQRLQPFISRKIGTGVGPRGRGKGS